jgi:uncharacterized protein YyaL (SSP411 family)
MANRLIQEQSPYLRQHASNPVDWFPWGPEAFARARAENKPIFLSVGYSTCHWCHVMERESFTDPEIARLLGASFVSIKVDREERPDIDRVYMTFVQAATGGGGWPMSVWLTPELKPFFGGTYFPPQNLPGRPGFKAVLAHLAGLWTSQRDQIVQRSDHILATLIEATRSAAADRLPIAELRERAFGRASESFDEEHGGFGSAPKFPRPAMIEFLLDVHATSLNGERRDRSLAMVLRTLRRMAAGGMHDQLGGGFHRYAVDAGWRIPHFEKMLYDQAQLAAVYLAAWQLSADPALGEAARKILGYVRRQLTSPEGGFYSAEDADSARPSDPSAHGEGAFYVWTAREIEAVLGPENAALFGFAYGVGPEGNAAPDPHGEFAGQNILFRARSDAACAAEFGLTEKAARSAVAAAAQHLFTEREKRPRPQRDNKIITAWNGLMISAFARAAQVLGDSNFAVAAERAASLLHERLFDPATGRLARTYCAGVRDRRGFAEDYAFLIQGLLDLYEATFAVRWLEWAIQLQEKQNELFWDSAAGGYFSSADDDATVLLRLKEDHDGAEPSPNSVAVRNLARLAAILHRDDWRDLALRTARAFGGQLDRQSTAMPQMLASLGWLEGSPRQIVIAGEPEAADTRLLIGAVWRQYLPRRTLVRLDRASRQFFSAKFAAIADVPEGIGGPAAAYICEDFVCRAPIRDPVELMKSLL